MRLIISRILLAIWAGLEPAILCLEALAQLSWGRCWGPQKRLFKLSHDFKGLT
jgi:hypothetical protein